MVSREIDYHASQSSQHLHWIVQFGCPRWCIDISCSFRDCFTIMQCVILTKFLQVLDIWHEQTWTKIKRTSIDVHNLGLDIQCDLSTTRQLTLQKSKTLIVGHVTLRWHFKRERQCQLTHIIVFEHVTRHFWFWSWTSNEIVNMHTDHNNKTSEVMYLLSNGCQTFWLTMLWVYVLWFWPEVISMGQLHGSNLFMKATWLHILV